MLMLQHNNMFLLSIALAAALLVIGCKSPHDKGLTTSPFTQERSLIAPPATTSYTRQPGYVPPLIPTQYNPDNSSASLPAPSSGNALPYTAAYGSVTTPSAVPYGSVTSNGSVVSGAATGPSASAYDSPEAAPASRVLLGQSTSIPATFRANTVAQSAENSTVLGGVAGSAQQTTTIE